nr:hypothetical protein [Tanacetum cinerariifolium]
MDQAKKLGLPPSPALATFRMTSEEKKRKRTQFFKEALITEDIRVDGMNRNWIPPPGVMRIEGLVMKRLFECIASKSNIRRIRVKDIDKEVEDYLKKYSSAGMDISWIDPNPMKCPEDIKTYSNLRPKQKLFQYLNALDQKYEPVKREILRLEPLPSAKAAYAVVRKEAAHQNILGETSNDTHGIAGDLVATETKGLWLVTNGHRRFEGKRNGPSGKEDKTKLKYGNCGKTRHTKEQCFEIIGYPDWWNDGHKKETKNLGPERGKASAANIGQGESIHEQEMFTTQEDTPVHQIEHMEEQENFPTQEHTLEAKALALSMYSDEILSNTEQALKSKHWKDAMEEEMKALTKNNT